MSHSQPEAETLSHEGQSKTVKFNKMGDNSRKLAAVVVVGIIVLVLVVVLSVVLSRSSDSTSHLPGLTVYPSARHINYSPSSVEDNTYISELTAFIQDYKSPPEGSIPCNATISPGSNQSCQFEASWLTTCSEERNWGYNMTEARRLIPCLLVTPNKLVDWVPDVYESIEDLPDAMPQRLKSQIQLEHYEDGLQKRAYVSCEVVGGGGLCSLTPWHGFPLYYFPYKADPSYRSPVLAASITMSGNVAEKMKAEVEFQLWVKDVNPNDTTVRITIEANP